MADPNILAMIEEMQKFREEERQYREDLRQINQRLATLVKSLTPNNSNNQDNIVEKQLSRNHNFNRGNAFTNSTIHPLSYSAPIISNCYQPLPPSSNSFSKVPVSCKAIVHCHNCQSMGHYERECSKPQPHSFVNERIEEEEGLCTNMEEEEVIEENPENLVAENLVVRRLCLTPYMREDWKRHAMFKTMCIIKDKKFVVITDSRRLENAISEEGVQKLQVNTVNHLNPYKLGWVTKENQIQVDKRCKFKLTLGPQYTTTRRRKGRFSRGKYHKPKKRKIVLCEILKKFGANTYRVKLPREFHISNTSSVIHLHKCNVSNASLRSSFNQPRESDVVHVAGFLESNHDSKSPTKYKSNGDLYGEIHCFDYI